MARKAAKKAVSPSNVSYPEGCEGVDPSSSNTSLALSLKNLYECLCEEGVDTDDNFASLSSHLVNQQLLNKPADVSVYVALCLAQIFVILHPNNPFDLNNEELKEALEFIAKSLGRIRIENEAIYARYHNLLELVSSNNILQNIIHLDGDKLDGSKVICTLIKSAALIVEVRKAHDRVFDEKKEEESDRKGGIRSMIMHICRGVVENCSIHMQGPALDALFSYLISPEKINNPEAYHFMRELCESESIHLNSSIEKVFVDAFQKQDDPNFDSQTFKLVGKRKGAIYELITEMADLLQDIRMDLLTLLVTRLRSSVEEVRLFALRTSCDVSRTRPDTPEVCPLLWETFITKAKDSSPLIRKEFAERVSELIYAHHDMRSPIWKCLEQLVVDMDEDVRIAALQTVCQTARKKLEAVNENLIIGCTERIRDRKTEVRKIALKYLLALYKDIVKREDSTKSDRGVIAIIAKKVIMASKATEAMTDERVMIEKGLIHSLLPMELDMRKRMELLVEMSTRFNSHEIRALNDLLTRVVVGRRILNDMVLAISIRGDGIEKTSEERKKDTQNCIEKLVRMFPNPQKAEGALRKFCNLLCTDNESMNQMQKMLNKEITVDEAQGTVKELLSRAANGKDELNKEQQEIIRSMLTRLAPLLIDKTSLIELTRYLKDIIDGETIGKEGAVSSIDRAISIYKILSDLYPSYLNNDEIVYIIIDKFLDNDNQFVVKCGIQCCKVMLGKEGGKNGEGVRNKSWFKPLKNSLYTLMKEGSPSCAKHALHSLIIQLGCDESWELVKEDIEDAMATLDSTTEKTTRSLSLLRRAIGPWNDKIIDNLVDIYPTEIASKILVPNADTYDGGITIDFPATEKKAIEDIPRSISMNNTIGSIKLAVRFLPLLPSSDQSKSLILKTIRVLSMCCSERGRVADDLSDCDTAWLSAVAGAGLVKMMTHRRIAKEFASPFIVSSLSFISLHPMEAVRLYFVNRVFKYYRMNTLISPFLSLIPISQYILQRGELHESDETLRNQLQFLLSQCIQFRNVFINSTKTEDLLLRSEYMVAHFIVLLSQSTYLTNHNDEEELTRLAETLWLTIESMMRVRQSIKWELIVSILHQLKITYPITEGDDDEERDNQAKKMWSLSDIMLHLLIYKAKLAINASTEKIKLPAKFFEVKCKDNNKIYAPKTLLKRIEEGRIQYEFTKLKASTTMKDTTKKEVKTRGRKKKVVKKGESDEEMESEPEIEEEEDEKIPSTSNRRGGRRKVMETVKEEDDEDEDNDGIYDVIDDDDIPIPGPSNKRSNGFKNRLIASVQELEEIDLSPINGRRGRGIKGLVVSTPLIRNGEGDGEVEVTTPKRGRGRPPKSLSVSPIKLSKSQSKSPVKMEIEESSRSSRGRRGPTKSYKDDIEDEPVRKRGRPSMKKKKEEEIISNGKKNNDNDEEGEGNEPIVKRERSSIRKTKTTIDPIPCKKTSSRGRKKK